ncbi:hypothetical protein ACFC96_35945 [Streptomyces sp. NPDC055955]|uniref:hypothetical protein n=1 Tax=Streptomyces sp. NPDC055955 TaxID=3345665 RepID=UPI0035E1AA8B
MSSTGPSRSTLYLEIPLGSLHFADIIIRAWQKEPGNAVAYQSSLHRVAEIAIAEARSQAGADVAPRAAAHLGRVSNVLFTATR